MKTLSRRQFLKASGLLTSMAALPRWMPRLAFAQPYDNPAGDVLLVIFLRGGADALNMVVPHGDDTYYAARPRLAIPRPDARDEARTLDLDGFFGLHPALAPLLPIFQAGQMTAVHAVGSTSDTRSHFEAMDFMERGTPDDTSMVSGWVARHLASLATDNDSPVRGVGWGTALQQSLATAPSTVALKSITDYHLNGDERQAQAMMQSLMSLYTLGDDALQRSAAATQSASDVVQSVGYARYVSQNGATYPETDFALALRQTAALIRADVGLEVACLDLGGWDTHLNQGGTTGRHASLLTQLANGMSAFHQDMGPDMRKVTAVVMSEFGRRVAENAGAGTDHGHGGAVFIMSGNLSTSAVVADWRGLSPEVLDRGEDIPSTTDFRDVLSTIIHQRLGNPNVDAVFPNYTPELLSLFQG
ncbi:MAG: DUF1501 domain-containing protein [Chloroflexota bacterium]